MRTRQPATELGVVFLLVAGKKHGQGTNPFSYFFFKLFSEKQNSGRDKASWSSQHQKKSKFEDQTENRARTRDMVTVELAYSTVLVLRGRGRSNHVATKTLPRLAPGQ